MFHQLCGIISAILAFLFYARIIYALYTGQTKSSRVTWLIWGVNDFLILSASFAVGAWNTLWVPLVYVVSGVICVFLSVKHDKIKLSKIDLACLFLSIIAWLIWAITKSPTTALILAVIVNTLGAIPTWRRLYKSPGTEAPLPWAIVTLAGVFQLLALEKYTLGLMLFPSNSFLVSSTTLMLSLRKFSKSG